MIVTGGLGTGGLERISCFIANKFCEKGWKVVILTLLQQSFDRNAFHHLNENVDVVSFDKKYDPLFHKIKAIKVWRKMIKDSIKQYQPNSILAMTFKIASMVCLFSPKYANRVTVREISDPKSKVRNQLINRITEFLCRKVKNIIFQTKWEKACFHKKIQNKGVVIPNPLSIKPTNYGNYNDKTMFTLSRLTINQKRQDVMIRAFELFHKTHNDYHLKIYGQGDDKDKLLDIISKTTCQNNISIENPISNVHDTVLNYRCFLLTSDFEGMSNALLECYSLGIPCISSDWPGVEDVITNKVDGLIYKRQDIIELANLMTLIAEDDELCKTLTNNAIKGSSRFEEGKIIDKYCEVIEGE